MGTAGTLTNLDGPSLVAPKKPPWSVIAFVITTAAAAGAEIWYEILSGAPANVVYPADELGSAQRTTARALYTVLAYAGPPLFAAASAYGVWLGNRFLWFVAILWQLQSAGYGVFNLLINEYGWSTITSYRGSAFFHGALPIAFGAIMVILLLLPPTRRWVHGARYV